MGERGFEGGDAAEEGFDKWLSLMLIELLLLLLFMTMIMRRSRRKMIITKLMNLEEGMQWWWVLLGLKAVTVGKSGRILGLEEHVAGQGLEELIRCGQMGWW